MTTIHWRTLVARLPLFALGLLLLLAPAGHAADCTTIEQRSAGGYTITSLYLLDSDTASATGATCDLNTVGAPDMLRVSVSAAAGCASGWSAEVQGRDTATGVARGLVGLRNDRHGEIFEASFTAPTPRYVRAVSQGLSGCTDFDLIAEVWIRNDVSPDTTECDDLLWASVDPTEAGATDDFVDFLDRAGSTIEGNEDNFLVHQARRAHSARCEVATAPGAGDTWLVTLRQGAAGALADTTLTCAISNTDTVATSTGFVDITAGNVITASIDSSTGATDPDANALITVSLCLGD